MVTCISKKKLYQKAYCLLFFLFVFFYIFKDIEATGKSFLIVFGFSFIGILSCGNIMKDARVISANKFFWYFQLVFMCIAPLCQYLSGYFPWGVEIIKNDIKKAILYTILWNILYTYLYYKKRRITIAGFSRTKLQNFFVKKRNCSSVFFFFMFLCSFVCFLALVKMIGFHNLFFRNKNVLNIQNSTINFIVRKFLTAFPAVVCAMFILSYREKKSPILLLGIFVLLLITLCVNFPTSTTRYWMGTIFIGIALIATIQRKESRIIDYGIVLGLFIMFPLFYFFKTMTIEDLFNGSIGFNGIAKSLNTIDFDAFTLLARSMRYVRENGITWGKQLVNIILFFVPRAIWKTKPITTNVLIASSQNQVFTNLSCPLSAEGYVNFGVLGIVFYCIVYAKFNQILDDLYWKKAKAGEFNLINMMYPFLCVFTLYINRGPLQPAIIQTIALLLPFFY